MSLTRQQELFCREYIARKFNATEAYRHAYPKSAPGSAGPNSARLIANDKVQARIAELTQQAAAQEGITPAKVLRELGFIAMQRKSQIYRDDGSLKSPSEWDEATDATIASIETEEELAPDDGPDEEQEPQPHGGSLKRSRLKVKLVRTVKVKRWDKVKALELFMRHFGLLKEDAPHPDRPKIDFASLSEEEQRVLLALADRSLGGPPG